MAPGEQPNCSGLNQPPSSRALTKWAFKSTPNRSGRAKTNAEAGTGFTTLKTPVLAGNHFDQTLVIDADTGLELIDGNPLGVAMDGGGEFGAEN